MIKFKNILITGILFLGIGVIVSAQEHEFTANAIPNVSTPTAAGFMPVGSFQSNLYNGMLTANIPLYTIQDKGIKVPISLGYATKGVKVNEVGSWTGIGWHLNTGGVITRTVNSMPDEYHGYYRYDKLKEDFTLEAWNTLTVYGYLHEGDRYQHSNLHGSPLEDPVNQARILYDTKTVYDSEPDIFSFSCGGISGQFSFKPDRTILVSCNQKVEITPNFVWEDGDLKYIDGFTVVIPNGYKYTFGKAPNSAEKVMVNRYDAVYGLPFSLVRDAVSDFEELQIGDDVIFPYAGGNLKAEYVSSVPPNTTPARFHYYSIDPHYTTWYLTEIETPTGEKVILEYRDGIETSYIGSTSESVNCPNFSYLPGKGWHLWPRGLVSQSISTSFGYTETVYTPKYLERIITSNGQELRFNLLEDDPREDLDNALLLESIEIYNNSGFVKSISFDYWMRTGFGEFQKGLIIGSTTQRYDYRFKQGVVFNDMVESLRRRYFLTKITETDRYGNVQQPYELNYNITDLPPRHSFHQDKNGYFEINNGVRRVPDIDIKSWIHAASPTLAVESWDLFSTVSRVYDCPDQDNLSLSNPELASILTEVIYPTKAKKVFEYEKDLIGIRLKSIHTYPDKDKSQYYTKSYVYSEPKSLIENLADTNVVQIGHSERDIFQANMTSTIASSPYLMDMKMYTLSSTYTKPLPTSPEKLIYYREVTEVEQDKGHTKYVFNMPAKEYPQTYNNSFLPDTTVNMPVKHHYYSWTNGSLAHKAINKGDIGTETTLKSSTYRTKHQSTESAWALVPYVLDYYNNSNNATRRYYAALHEIRNKWTYVDTVTSVEHLEGGDIHKMQTIQVDLDTKLPNTVETTKSDESETKKVMKYVGDYATGTITSANGDAESQAIYTMYSNNQINVPVEIVSLKNDQVIGGKLLSYKTWEITNKDGETVNLNLPTKEFNLVTGDPMTIGPMTGQFEYSFIDSSSGYDFSMDDQYEAVSFFDQYDEYGNLLQMHGRDDIPVSFQYGHNGKLLKAKAVDANYDEIWVEDFEDKDTADTDIFYGFSKSGKKSKKAIFGDNTAYGKLNLVSGKDYTISFWARKGTSPGPANVIIEGITNVSTTATLNTNWAYYETSFYVPAGSGGEKNIIIKTGTTGSIDETVYTFIDNIRIHPTDARLETYTYDGVTNNLLSQTDATGYIMNYEYDASGRLITVKDRGNNILKTMDYHIKGENIQGPDFEITSALTDMEVYESGTYNASITVHNTGDQNAPCELLFTYPGYPEIYKEAVINAGQTHTFTETYDVSGSENTTQVFNVSGTISDNGSVKFLKRYELVEGMTYSIDGRKVQVHFKILNRGTTEPTENITVKVGTQTQDIPINFTGEQIFSSGWFDMGAGCTPYFFTELWIKSLKVDNGGVSVPPSDYTDIQLTNLELTKIADKRFNATITLQNFGGRTETQPIQWEHKYAENYSPSPPAQATAGAVVTNHSVPGCYHTTYTREFNVDSLDYGFHTVKTWCQDLNNTFRSETIELVSYEPPQDEVNVNVNLNDPSWIFVDIQLITENSYTRPTAYVLWVNNGEEGSTNPDNVTVYHFNTTTASNSKELTNGMAHFQMNYPAQGTYTIRGRVKVDGEYLPEYEDVTFTWNGNNWVFVP